MKAVYGVILAIMLGSCSPFGLNPMGYEVLHEDLDVAWKKVSAMKYIAEEADYWKSPAEFFADGGGDCEDFAIALMYLLGPDAKFAICINDRQQRHAIVIYHKHCIEPQIYDLYLYGSSIIEEWEYSVAMQKATTFCTKSLGIQHL